MLLFVRKKYSTFPSNIQCFRRKSSFDFFRRSQRERGGGRGEEEGEEGREGERGGGEREKKAAITNNQENLLQSMRHLIIEGKWYLQRTSFITFYTFRRAFAVQVLVCAMFREAAKNYRNLICITKNTYG